MNITKRQLRKIIREAVRAPRGKVTPTTPGRAKRMLRRKTRRGRYKGEDFVGMIMNAIHRGGFETAADLVMDAILGDVRDHDAGTHIELAKLLAAARDDGLFNRGYDKIEQSIATIASDWYKKHFGN